MSEKAGAHAIAGLERFLHVRTAGAFGVLKQIKIGDAGVINVAAMRQNARADAVVEMIEAVGEDGCFVGFAIAIGIGQQADAVRFLVIIGDALALVFGHVGVAFGD